MYLSSRCGRRTLPPWDGLLANLASYDQLIYHSQHRTLVCWGKRDVISRVPIGVCLQQFILIMQVIVLCYVTISGIQKFQNYNFQNMRSTTSQDDSVVFQKSIASSGWLPSCSSVITTAPTEESGCQTSSVKVTDTEDDVFKSCTSSHSTRRRQLMMNPRLRLVCYLTITFVICTIMIPIAFFVDLIETKLPHIGFRFASMVLVQIYTLLCPILLVRYLSSLQTALANVASSMSWCWRRAYGAKTQVKSRNKTKLEN